MDEIVITQPAPTTPHFPLPRKIILTVLGIASAAALVVLSFLFFERFFGPPGSLQLTSLRPGVSVTVDGIKVGSADYRGDFRPGPHTVIASDDHKVLPSWRNQVDINSGTLTAVEVDLGPSDGFSGATVLSLSRGRNLTVRSSPAGAQVSLDGTDIGTTPLSRPSPGPGVHTLKLILAGYLDKSVQINQTSDWQVDSFIKLYKSPSFAVKLLEEQEIKTAPASDLTITERASLGLDKILTTPPPESYAAWSKAQFISLGGDELSAQPETYLKALYLHSLAHLLLPDLPYQYLIDKDGKIYEGRSGGFSVTTLDVSTSLEATAQTPTVRPGWLLVGYLGTTPTSAATDSFHKLVAFLGQSPKLSATTNKAEVTASIEAAGKSDLSLTFHNTGLSTWFNAGDNRIVLSAANPSAFFASGGWIDSKTPATTVENYVPKGSDGTFRFSLSAPKYGGDYSETYNLIQAGRTAAGSSITLKIHVNGPAKPPVQVRIEDTSTGFLRVRSGPGLNYAEVAKVKPGETYDFLDEQNGWYKIKLSDTSSGWVSAQFATKINL